MKKCNLFLVCCCMASSLLAQSPSPFELQRKQLQHLMQATPGLHYSEISPSNGLSAQLLPPLSEPYNLVDSVYEYTWDSLDAEWAIRLKWFFENDCAIGRPLTVVSQIDSLGDGNFTNYSKIVYGYFDNGNLQKYETYLWNPVQQTWEQFFFFSYLRPNEPSEEVFKFWNSSTNSFEGGEKKVYNYNDDNKLQSIENYSFNIASNDWTLSWRHTYLYTNGLNTEVLGESYQQASNTWELFERTTNTYDPAGNLLTSTNEYDYGFGLRVESKDIFAYNASNLLVEHILQLAENVGLKNYSKTKYQYYDSGSVERNDKYEWLPMQQDWLMDGQTAFREDGKLNYSWAKSFSSDTSSQFDIGFQSRYLYSNEGLLENRISETFVPQGPAEWAPVSKINYTYNDDNRHLEDVFQDWDNNLMDYVNDYRYYYFNTGCLFNQADETQPQALVSCLHANPLQPGQAIQCSSLPQTDGPLSLSLYGMTGTLLHQQDFLPGDAFQPQQRLAPGLYLLDIRTGKGDLLHRAKVVVME